jgi:hypothetical protein
VSEQPSVNFHLHLFRGRNEAGARVDFEQMIGRLVAATTGREASLSAPDRADWGIDVLVGDLNGQATIWQVKYFSRGIGESQRSKIRRSFDTVMKRAAEKGFQVDRWVLCIPASMDPDARQWWDDWQAAQHRATGVDIELWDENKLRGLLLSPAAEDVYRHYYAPGLGKPFPIRRLVVLGAVGVFAAAFLSVGVWQLVAVNGTGPVTVSALPRQPTPRTQQEWATDVNAECRLTEPTLEADVTAVTGLPKSAFESVPIDSRIPKSLERLSADAAEITHLFRQVFPLPSSPDADVSQWLSDLKNRDATLAKATMYSKEISTSTSLASYFERVPAAVYLDEFVLQTDSMRSLAAKLAIGNCV